MPRDAVEGRRPRVFRSGFFRPLDSIPLRPNPSHILDLGLSKHMRMAANEFVRHDPGNFLDIECAPFPGQLAMKHNLQQQVPEFLDHLVVVARFDGIHQFVHFLDGVEA